jgi:GTP-binding protein
LKDGEIDTVLRATMAEVARHGAAYPQVLVTSAQKHRGIAELRQAVARVLV